WVWVILASKLAPFAIKVVIGSLGELEKAIWDDTLNSIDFAAFADRPVVVKGCSDVAIPASVYAEATKRLLPYAKKVSFGEPCSTVPVYKRG
ncbi:MAG: DUF2480 family protein, partial [Bacteroidia bacterium]